MEWLASLLTVPAMAAVISITVVIYLVWWNRHPQTAGDYLARACVWAGMAASYAYLSFVDWPLWQQRLLLRGHVLLLAVVGGSLVLGKLVTEAGGWRAVWLRLVAALKKAAGRHGLL